MLTSSIAWIFGSWCQLWMIITLLWLSVQSWQSLLELQPAATVTSKIMEMRPSRLPFLTPAFGLGSQSQYSKGSSCSWSKGTYGFLAISEIRMYGSPWKVLSSTSLLSGKTTQPSQPMRTILFLKKQLKPPLSAFTLAKRSLVAKLSLKQEEEPALESYVV